MIYDSDFYYSMQSKWTAAAVAAYAAAVAALNALVTP
jgi:hypothetical protein